MPAFDDEHSSNFFDYSAPSHLQAMQQQQRDDHKKKVLPPVHGAKMYELILLRNFMFFFHLFHFRPLPRHVLKFSFQELDIDSPEASIDLLRDGNTTRIRRRRIYMRLRVSHFCVY